MNKKQVYNPYLPLDVYIPDGEPHVFGNRVYVYGSHDKENGDTYCMLPYEVWSAPVEDLSDWSFQGVPYTGEGDPNLTSGDHYMYAPDCVQGNDGRFYLYYCKGGYCNPISVAVSEKPDGPFIYYGTVHNPDGTALMRGIPFDPAVMNDNGIIRLYYGAGYSVFANMENLLTRGFVNKITTRIIGKTPEQVKAEPDGIHGPVHVTLADDMLTVSSDPVKFMPSRTKGTQWDGHAFFEASSIRKIDNIYYFVYSSWNNHDLCYATSRYPDKDFVYRGVIISNGDVGIEGRKPKDRLNFTGNNHGGIECINGQWYVFYHRHTHDNMYSRQACAEPVQLSSDGTIKQAEMTSCGLNGGVLSGIGSYPATICCNLTNGKMPHGQVKNLKEFPKIQSADDEQYLSNLGDKVKVCYKYFDLSQTKKIKVKFRGDFTGKLIIKNGMKGSFCGEICLSPKDSWSEEMTGIVCKEKKSALCFELHGKGKLELFEFQLL